MLLWPCSTDGFTAWQFLAEIKAYREELEQLEEEATCQGKQILLILAIHYDNNKRVIH